MTYIWNRANRVPEEFKPQRIAQSFRQWENRLKKEYKDTTCSKRKKKILNKIKRQTISYEDSVAKYKKDLDIAS